MYVPCDFVPLFEVDGAIINALYPVDLTCEIYFVFHPASHPTVFHFDFKRKSNTLMVSLHVKLQEEYKYSTSLVGII